jgi:hypothetical protein
MSKGKNCTNYRKMELVRGAKSQPCSDCGESYPYYMMDFDHLPEFKKKFPLGRCVRYTMQEIIEELAKCEVVCANCHRARTHSRGYR